MSLDTSSIDQSRFAKYQLVIKKRNTPQVTNSELDLLTVDDHKTDAFLSFYRQVKVNELLAHVGDDKKYQKLILVFLCVFNFFYSFIAFQIPYVFYEPTYYCKAADSTLTVCSMEAACVSPFGFTTYSPIRSLVVENKLWCERRGYLHISQGLFVIIGGFMAFVFAFLSDKIGRKPIFLVSYILTIAGTFICLTSRSLPIIVVGNILSWSGMDTFFSMVFVYCNEMIGSALRSKSNALLFFCWGLGEVFFNLINIWIYDYQVIFFLQFFPLSIAGIGYFYLKESPYWLYKKKLISELYFVLRYIGLMNGHKAAELDEKLNTDLGLGQVMARRIEESDLIELRVQNPSSTGAVSTYLKGCSKLCNNRPQLLKLVGVTAITANIYIGYSLSLLIPQKIGLANLNINGAFLGISEIIGYFIVIPLGSIIPRRMLNFVCAASVVGLDIILLLFEFTGDSWSDSALRWSQTIVSCLIKLMFCINYSLIFNYCSELFPTRIRGMALGVCVFFGRFMIVMAFFLQNMTEYFDIHPMIGTIFGCLLILPITLCLPETVNQGISN
jgi:MFS family permease